MSLSPKSTAPVAHSNASVVAAANEAPSVPEGTTLFDLIAALQDAADESTQSQDEADLLVFASLIEMRHYLRSTQDASDRKVA